ncbi:MAG: hypothetical protein JOZ02_03675 [Acidobacteria bacterium]|nr:hypothetical protein [Acidobacteriota bacterium]
MQRKFIVFSVAAALLLNALGAAAQEIRQKVTVAPPEEEEIFIAQGPGVPAPPPQVEINGDNLIFMATEMSFAGKLVKGAPYSAQAVTESVQSLADGNRIVRKTTAQLYRDTEGRTRREQTVGFFGPFAASGEETQTVFINDPVSGVNYILEPSTKTARKLPRMEMHWKVESDAADSARQKAEQEVTRKVEVERTFNTRVQGPDAQVTGTAVIVTGPSSPDGVTFMRSSSKHEAKTEKLEARQFDGVTAEGSRTTVTIPAGEIGNEQPIQIVDERWYSPDLQAVVMTRHSDPRYGETTYRLTNISRTEPAATLFQVPSDYTVKEVGGPGAGVRTRTFRRTAPAPLAPPQEN